MISMKDYAANKSISYEAVRKQVNRYKDELEGHIFKQGRTQYLDEEAVAFLDDKRKSNPIVIINSDKDETIERLERENRALLLKIAELQDSLLTSKDMIATLQSEKILLLEENKKMIEEQQESQKTEEQPKGFFARLFRK